MTTPTSNFSLKVTTIFNFSKYCNWISKNTQVIFSADRSFKVRERGLQNLPNKTKDSHRSTPGYSLKAV